MQIRLRAWQREALRCYQQAKLEQRKSLLIEATPGAGKTSAALLLLTRELREEKVPRVLVVVPTAHLKLQWARAALKFGVHLNSKYSSTQANASGFHGAVVTYQQLAHSRRKFAQFAKGATAILDEIHHAGDGLTWGSALDSALRDANFILGLSGTAFRSDRNAIPFVSYSPQGESLPDYSYTYARAIEEGVCRPLVFLSYGGEISWSTPAQNLNESASEGVTADFETVLDKSNASKRLRAALDPKSGWILPVLRDAHQRLLETRLLHKDAGGLLVAANQTHARALARTLKEVSGVAPTVVLSDDETASKKIKEFSDGQDPWLVACNMVSEGVDIPRLRVGVYATTVRTQMYFRQFLGRIVRRTENPGGIQLAYCYLPADRELQKLAAEIEQEQRHFLNRADDTEFFGDEQERAPREENQKADFEALSAKNSGLHSVIVGGNQLSLFQTQGSVLHALEFPESSLNELIEQEVQSRLERTLTLSELNEGLRRKLKEMVARYHRKTGLSYSVIHNQLNQKQQVKSQLACNLGQLEERVKLLETLLNNQTQST